MWERIPSHLFDPRPAPVGAHQLGAEPGGVACHCLEAAAYGADILAVRGRLGGGQRARHDVAHRAGTAPLDALLRKHAEHLCIYCSVDVLAADSFVG